MKTLSLFIFLLTIGTALQAQTIIAKTKPSLSVDSAMTLEASCGQCNFKLKAKGCNLAIRIHGKAYFVDGVNIDDHGDAHAADGFCNAIRQAKVKGTIIGNRFKATYFKLLPEAGKKD